MSNNPAVVLRHQDPETGLWVWLIQMRCQKCPDILENIVGLLDKKNVPQIITRMDAEMDGHYKKEHSRPYIIAPGGKS